MAPTLCRSALSHPCSEQSHPFPENWSEKCSDLPSGRQPRGGTPARPFRLQAHRLELRLGGPHARTKGRARGAVENSRGAWKQLVASVEGKVAVVTLGCRNQYTRLSGLNNRELLLTELEAGSAISGYQHGWVLGTALLLVCCLLAGSSCGRG